MDNWSFYLGGKLSYYLVFLYYLRMVVYWYFLYIYFLKFVTCWCSCNFLSMDIYSSGLHWESSRSYWNIELNCIFLFQEVSSSFVYWDIWDENNQNVFFVDYWSVSRIFWYFSCVLATNGYRWRFIRTYWSSLYFCFVFVCEISKRIVCVLVFLFLCCLLVFLFCWMFMGTDLLCSFFA